MADADALSPLTVRVPRAVELLGISRSELYRLIGSGAIESVKVGRARLVVYASVVRMVERLKVPTA